MRITAELSLYPLEGDVIAKVLAFVDDLTGDPRVEVTVNQMSTQLRGELHHVMTVLQRALERSFSSGDSEVLVAKLLNADLPILERPELDAG